MHPDICISETMEQLADPDIEVTFTRLWTHCDDHGRCPDNLLLIKAAIYPLRERVTADVLDEWLNILARARLIHRYEVHGKPYIAVRSWGEFQHPNRPKDSKYPEPPEHVEPPPPVNGTNTTRSRHRPNTDGTVTPHVPDTPGVGEGEGEGEGVGVRGARSLHALTLLPTTGPPPPVGIRPRNLPAYSTDFEAWWTLYPRKLSKRDARDAYQRALGHTTQTTITAGLRRSLDAWQHERRPADKIPYPAKWLNGRCWEDDHTATPSTPPEPKAYDAIRAGLQRRQDHA